LVRINEAFVGQLRYDAAAAEYGDVFVALF